MLSIPLGTNSEIRCFNFAKAFIGAKKKSTKPIFGAWFTHNSDSSLGCLHRTKSEVEVVLEAPGYVKTVLPK